jgi:hypothetical protein
LPAAEHRKVENSMKFTKSHLWVACVSALSVAIVWPLPALAYEADVHFGLTRWLALRAGFTESQADAIATADNRVDSGLVQTTQLDLEYACAGRFPEVARLVQLYHYPASKAVPAPPADRIVQAGSTAAHSELADVFALAKGKENLLLGRFGRALHPFQDSWAHQGVPSTPQLPGSLACDASLASGNPIARGGPDSHAADLTMRWPTDTLAMAQATYQQLLAWGPIEGHIRQAVPWDSLVSPVQMFAKASTKTEKHAWFLAQGMEDTRFLEGISLPDGRDPGPLDWNRRMLPPLPGNASQQHDTPADVRAFFDDFLKQWLSTQRVENLVNDHAFTRAQTTPATDEITRSFAELVARLKLWKLRDHGTAAALAHARGPLDAAQLKAVERMTRDPKASLAPVSVADAVLPLQPSTPAPARMLPYIVRSLPSSSGAKRMIAIARLRHAPYDTVGWIAEQRGDRWMLVDMVWSVDP